MSIQSILKVYYKCVLGPKFDLKYVKIYNLAAILNLRVNHKNNSKNEFSVSKLTKIELLHAMLSKIVKK